MLTRAQRRLLLFIQDNLDDGTPMSYREMAAKLGYGSQSNVQNHVRALIQRGYLAPTPVNRAVAFKVLRRITPIVEFRVWDEDSRQLVPYVPRQYRGIKKGLA